VQFVVIASNPSGTSMGLTAQHWKSPRYLVDGEVCCHCATTQVLTDEPAVFFLVFIHRDI
jgi:hypothetical protein